MSFELRTSADAEILVTGSVAFDQIMDFEGDFKDHILPDKLHTINLSFLVKEMKKQRGGCAANISYSLTLLGERPRILAAVGADSEEYRDWLRDQGVDLAGLKVFEDDVTACCFITTDRADNQITGFHPGAMGRAKELSVIEEVGRGNPRPSYCIVAPDDPEAMVRHCREARQAGVPLIFDPSFQVIAMEGETLRESAKGAHAVILNDYEFAVFKDKTGLDDAGVLELAEMWVVTLGEKGSEITLAGGEKIEVPSAKPKAVVDPTGAGDAFRAGFLAGLVQGQELSVCGRMGSVASAYAIENYGTQQHHYSREEFTARYRENFG